MTSVIKTVGKSMLNNNSNQKIMFGNEIQISYLSRFYKNVFLSLLI